MSETTAIQAMRGEIPFPQAGEGVTVRFTNADFVKIQEIFGEEAIVRSPAKIGWHDIRFIAECAKLGVRGQDKKPLPPEAYDHVPIEELGGAILDGIYIALFGRRFEEQQKWAQIEAARVGANSGPLQNPAG